MFYGVDLHSDNVKVAILPEDNATPEVKRFPLNSEPFYEFLHSLSTRDYVAVEASTNTFWFHDQVSPKVKQCFVLDPYKFSIISKSIIKTDKRDAIQMAKLLKYAVMTQEELPTVYVPTPQVRELRSLFSTYNCFKEQIITTKNNLHAILRSHGHKIGREGFSKKNALKEILSLDLPASAKLQITCLYESLLSLEKNAEEIKDEILRKGHIFSREIEILTSIKGISVFIAIAIMTDIGDIRRFPDSKELCSYLGCVPRVDSSNQTTRIGRINKHSRRLTRNLLLQSVRHFRTIKKYGEFYDRKINGKCAGKVRMALVHKVLRAIYNILTRDTLFYYVEPKNHQSKLNSYKKFLAKTPAVA